MFPCNAVLPPKTAASSFPGGGQWSERTGEVETRCDEKAKVSVVVRAASFAGDQSSQEVKVTAMKSKSFVVRRLSGNRTQNGCPFAVKQNKLASHPGSASGRNEIYGL